MFADHHVAAADSGLPAWHSAVCAAAAAVHGEGSVGRRAAVCRRAEGKRPHHRQRCRPSQSSAADHQAGESCLQRYTPNWTSSRGVTV